MHLMVSVKKWRKCGTTAYRRDTDIVRYSGSLGASQSESVHTFDMTAPTTLSMFAILALWQ